jgi:hypothetical protein
MEVSLVCQILILQRLPSVCSHLYLKSTYVCPEGLHVQALNYELFQCQVCIPLCWNFNCNYLNKLHMIVEIHVYTNNSSFGCW